MSKMNFETTIETLKTELYLTQGFGFTAVQV